MVKEKEVNSKEDVKIEEIKVEKINEEIPVVKELVKEDRGKCACKKRKRFGLGFLFGLIVGVLSCIGVLLWHGYTMDRVDTKESNNEKEVEEKREEINLTKDSEEAKILMKQLSNYDLLLYFYVELGKEEIKNQDLLFMAAMEFKFKETITLAEIEKLIGTYYDIKITPENISCREGYHLEKEDVYIYNKDKKVFEYNINHGGHGIGYMRNYDIYNRFKELKTYKEEDKEIYELTVLRAYSDLMPDIGFGTEAYYKTYEDSASGENGILTIPYNEQYEIEKGFDVEKELEKLDEKNLSKETFTFVKKGENFLLTKYTTK